MRREKVSGYLKEITILSDPEDKHDWKCWFACFYPTRTSHESVLGKPKWEEWVCNTCHAVKDITRVDLRDTR